MRPTQMHPQKRTSAHTTPIAFRLTEDRMLVMERLKDTFPDCSWRRTMEWLIDQPEVEAAISRRLAQPPLG